MILNNRGHVVGVAESKDVAALTKAHVEQLAGYGDEADVRMRVLSIVDRTVVPPAVETGIEDERIGLVVMRALARCEFRRPFVLLRSLAVRSWARACTVSRRNGISEGDAAGLGIIAGLFAAVLAN